MEAIANVTLIKSLHRANWRYCRRHCWRYSTDSSDWSHHPGCVLCIPEKSEGTWWCGMTSYRQLRPAVISKLSSGLLSWMYVLGSINSSLMSILSLRQPCLCEIYPRPLCFSFTVLQTIKKLRERGREGKRGGSEVLIAYAHNVRTKCLYLSVYPPYNYVYITVCIIAYSFTFYCRTSRRHHEKKKSQRYSNVQV